MGLNMSDERLDKILSSTGRLEAMAVATQHEIAELKDETRQRANAHAANLRSLNKTRDRQIGGAKVVGVVGTIIGVVVGWFKYG